MATLDLQDWPRVTQAPLLPIALATVVGIGVDRVVSVWDTSTWLILAGLSLIATILGRHGSRGRWALVIVWWSLSGAWHHACWFDVPADDLVRLHDGAPRPAWLRGVVLDPPTHREGRWEDDEGYTRTVVQVTDRSDGQTWSPIRGTIRVNLDGDRRDLRAGQAVELVGVLAPIDPPRNPGEFSHRDHARALGIRLTLRAGRRGAQEVDPAQLTISTPEALWLRGLGALRSTGQEALAERLGEPNGALAAAMLLGRRERLDDDVRDRFARTGMIHLLAISGLHLQILALTLMGLLRLIGLDRRPMAAVVSVAVLGYAVLIGMMPSINRAAVMTLALCLGILRDRPTQAMNMNLLSATIIITLWLNPAYLFEVGWQLSFLAVATILWIVLPLTRRAFRSEDPLDHLEIQLERWMGRRRLIRRIRRELLQTLLISTLIWLILAPLICFYFHIVAPVGILLNLPMVPLAGLALISGGLTLVSSLIHPALSSPFAWACDRTLGLMNWVINEAANWPGGHWYEAGPPAIWVAICYLLLAITWLGWSSSRSWRRLASMVLAAWIAIGLVWSRQPERPAGLEIEVLAVGHGLAVLIQDTDGRVWIYDCGRLGDPTVGRRIAAPALWRRRVRQIEAIYLSHPDADHYNGTLEILERFDVGAVRVGPQFSGPANPSAMVLETQIARRGVEVETVAQGHRQRITGGEIRVIHPDPDQTGLVADNDRSLVLLISNEHGRHVLLTGDIDLGGLVQLTGHEAPDDLDVVLAPHHGGRTANPAWFYHWAEPGQVVASQRWSRGAEEGNDALGPLAVEGLPVHRTWRDGAVLIRWDDDQPSVRTFLETPDGQPDGEQEIVDETTTGDPSVDDTQSETISTALRGIAIGLGAVLAVAASLTTFAFVMLVEFGARILTRPRNRRRTTQEDTGATRPNSQVAIRMRDGAILVAHWQLPTTTDGSSQPIVTLDDPGPPIAILCHGFAEDGSSPAITRRAEWLVDRGWRVLIPDSRAHGRSGGRAVSFGGREADDLCTWLTAIRRASDRPDHRPTILVWGRSMGAAVASLAAARDSSIAGLILEAPYADLVDASSGWFRLVGVPSGAATLLARASVARARLNAGRSLRYPRPIAVAPKIEQPTLLLVGSDDPIARPDRAEALRNVLGRPSTGIHVVGAEHNDIFEQATPDDLDALNAFLDRLQTEARRDLSSHPSPRETVTTEG